MNMREQQRVLRADRLPARVFQRQKEPGECQPETAQRL
ncbi:hypothetical protein BN128_3100 [Cronobacter sakazakii 696]|nr:hypothetical protein BN128_3100 [Cronobacter sakazakii 696]